MIKNDNDVTETFSKNNSSLTTRNRQSKLSEVYRDNYAENRVTEFRPSSQVDYENEQFDQNGNGPWSPAPSLKFDENYIEDDEYYFDENDVTEDAEPREDDDESIRVAVWVDPSVKTNMGGLMNGIRKFVRGRDSNSRPKQKKPSSSYGSSSSNNNNKLKDFVKNILPKNNNNNNNYQNSGYGGGKGKNQGFKLPELPKLFKGKGQNSQNSQYGQVSTTRRPPKLPSLPKLPSFPNPFKGKGSTTRTPSTDYGVPPAPSSGYGTPTRTPNSGRPKKKKKVRTRKPSVNSNQIPSTRPDFVFGSPIR